MAPRPNVAAKLTTVGPCQTRACCSIWTTPRLRISLVARYPSSELNAAPPANAMPSHRFTVFPLASWATNVRSRESLMFFASRSRVKSQETFSQVDDPALRYIGLGTRRREMASCSELAPLGHKVPSLTGLSGSPSICSSSTFPPLSFLVYASSEQPTAQYGQIERETVAPSMRSCRFTPAALVRSKPSAETPARLAPAAPNPRNWRRVTSSTARPSFRSVYRMPLSISRPASATVHP